MRYIILFFFFSLFIFFAGDARANTGTIEIEPAYITVDLIEPAQEKDFTINIKNNTAKTINLEIFPIDFKQQNEKGGISFIGKELGIYSYSLSSFLALETDNLIIDPNKTKEIRISVKNRPDLSPGGHYAAVVAKLLNDNNKENAVSPAISSLIFMRKVGGERFNLSLKEVDWPENFIVLSYSSLFDLAFQNEGNVHLTPYGRGEIKDIFGRLLFKGIVNNTSAIVMPESRRLIPVQFKKINNSFPISLNTIEIKGSDSLKKVNYSYKEYFIYVNPMALLGVIILIIGSILLKIKRKRFNYINIRKNK